MYMLTLSSSLYTATIGLESLKNSFFDRPVYIQGVVSLRHHNCENGINSLLRLLAFATRLFAYIEIEFT